MNISVWQRSPRSIERNGGMTADLFLARCWARRARSLAMTLALALASCMPPPQVAVEASRPTPPASPPVATAANEQPAAPRSAPQVFPGTGVLVGTPSASRPARVVASDGGISFNFANADVRDVVREILGEQLHLDYVVDPKVQGTITAQTGAPVPR